MKEKCENCKYWKEIGSAKFDNKKSKKSGQCRRRSPKITKSNSATMKYKLRFPFSAFDDWCGEYKERQQQHVSTIRKMIMSMRSRAFYEKWQEKLVRLRQSLPQSKQPSKEPKTKPQPKKN